MSVTYQNMLDQFNDITGETTRYHLNDNQVDRFANRALQEICERCRYKDWAIAISAVASQGVYTISGVNAYDIFRVEYDDEVLWPISHREISGRCRNWETRTGRPRFYYLDGVYDTTQGSSFGLFEAPSSNLSAGITAWIHLFPTLVDAGSAPSLAAEVDIPEWATGAMLFYMLYLAYTAETRMQNLDTASVYKMMYEDLLERLMNRSRDRQPKQWISGAASSPSLNVLNRLPERITP